MASFYLISGTLLLILVIYDFFFTTLSGNGAGIVTKFISSVAHNLTRFFVRHNGRGLYRYSGLIVNLLVLAVWVVMVWIGLYLLYSKNPEALVDSSGRAANNWERLYFTGYTLSTLGLGDFKPATPFYQVLTSCFSFFGFIFFTSSMTYLISLSTAVINKRTLARSINNLGRSPEAIAEKMTAMDPSFSQQQILTLQEMTDRHLVNHQAYPVLHFYSHPNPEFCISISLTRMDEALSLLLTTDKGEGLKEELMLLRTSITYFLNHINSKFPHTLPKREEPITSLPYELDWESQKDLKDRRKILGGFLRSESFGWQDVSSKN